MKELLKYLSDIFTIAILYIGFIALFLVLYTNYTWGNVYVEQMIIAALNDFDTIGSYIITKYILFAFVPACLMTLICRWFIKKNLWLNIASICMIGYAVWSIKLVEYLLNQNVYTELYETEYVNPSDLNYKFPDKKRNLILFYLESMEADYADSNLTGENLLPNLSNYQKNGLHFGWREYGSCQIGKSRKVGSKNYWRRRFFENYRTINQNRRYILDQVLYLLILCLTKQQKNEN